MSNLSSARELNNREILEANAILSRMTPQERNERQFPERFNLFDNYDPNDPRQLPEQRSRNDVNVLNQVLEYGEQEERRIREMGETLRNDVNIGLPSQQEIVNTSSLNAINRNEDPIYTKETLEGIIKDSLEVIKNNCLMYEDDIYPQQSVCNLKNFLKRTKSILIRKLEQLKSNMTPEDIIEYQHYQNSFKRYPSQLDPYTPPSLSKMADRSVRDSLKSRDLGTIEELNQIMEVNNLPPVYAGGNYIVYKINLVKKIYKALFDITEILRSKKDQYGSIDYEVRDSIIYMMHNERNNKYSIICSAPEFEYHETVAYNLDDDFSNLLPDMFFLNILGFANRLNDIFEYGGYESYGGKIKSKNKKKSRKTKRKTKRKMSKKSLRKRNTKK
jgi:hypothetical protein